MRGEALALAGVIAAAFPSAASACTALPAPSAQGVPVNVFALGERAQRTVLRVCVHGRTVELARGTMRAGGVRIGAASAAGHRVAWIAERRRGRVRTVTVTLAAVGRRVRVLRRFTVQRQRTRLSAHLDVLLTREGDLAWAAGTDDDSKGVVAVKQPGKRTRRLDRYGGGRLTLEDGRTLRWLSGDISYGFFDLRPIDCRRRSRYTPFAGNARVLLTRGPYGPAHDRATVFRGCDLATGRDRVLIQNDSNLSVASDLTLVGLDRTWAVFTQVENDFDGGGGSTLTVVDVVTGRSRFAHPENGPVNFPAPRAGAPIAVTDGGMLAWITGGKLYAMTGTYDVVTLEEGGTLADLHAEGDAIVWTRDGAPRRVSQR